MDGNIVPQVNRYPGNKYKSFRSLAEAQEWIGIPRPSAPSSRSRDKSSTGLPASSTMPLDTDDGHTPRCCRTLSAQRTPSGRGRGRETTGTRRVGGYTIPGTNARPEYGKVRWECILHGVRWYVSTVIPESIRCLTSHRYGQVGAVKADHKLGS
jgi:hypothetical protein